jgi:hypothetical protein
MLTEPLFKGVEFPTSSGWRVGFKEILNPDQVRQYLTEVEAR